MRTRTYYRGPDAVVTSEVFVWRTTPPQVFVIRELHRVGLVRGGGDRVQPYQAMVLTMSMWPLVKAPVMVASAILVATVPLVAVVVYRRTRPRRWEIHAHYRGADVLMFASRDERIFNQVARALRRAMEDRDPHYNGNGAAAA
jgi:hypothetical protein